MKARNDRSSRFGGLKVLRVDSSARSEGSMSRRVADELIEQLREHEGAVEASVRDLAVEAPSFVDAAWVDANFTPSEQRNDEQKAALAESDALVAELKAADVLVIGVPISPSGFQRHSRHDGSTWSRGRASPSAIRRTAPWVFSTASGPTWRLHRAARRSVVRSTLPPATCAMCWVFWGSTMCTSWRPIG